MCIAASSCQTYLCPCPLNLVDGMRMGSSSLSSESWFPRAGWLWPSSRSCPSSALGSCLLQPPDVSSVASDWVLSKLSPSEEPGADEQTSALEQEASHGGSVPADATLFGPDSEGPEEKHSWIHAGLIHYWDVRFYVEKFLLWIFEFHSIVLFMDCQLTLLWRRASRGQTLSALHSAGLRSFGTSTAERGGCTTAPIEEDHKVFRASKLQMGDKLKEGRWYSVLMRWWGTHTSLTTHL